MSNPTTPFGWQMPTNTDLVTDLPADFEVFGQAVATSLADLLGGTTGQVLAKNTNADMDFVWTSPNPGDITEVTAGIGISGGGTSGAVTITNSMATAIDAKGDLIVGTGADTFARLASSGVNNDVLMVDTSTATGLKFAAPAGGAGNLAQIATGTLSGTTVSLTGLSTYSELIFKADQVTYATANNQVLLRLNNNSTSNYSYFGSYMTNQPAGGEIYSNSDTCFRITKQNNSLYNGVSNCFIVKITNCKSTGFTDIHIISAYQNQSFYMVAENSMGVFRVNSAISSIDLLISAGYSFNGGNYTLWGA